MDRLLSSWHPPRAGYAVGMSSMRRLPSSRTAPVLLTLLLCAAPVAAPAAHAQSEACASCISDVGSACVQELCYALTDVFVQILIEACCMTCASSVAAPAVPLAGLPVAPLQEVVVEQGGGSMAY